MIPLEKQVTSLELSKQLKELKCQQDSLWHWVYLENEVCQDWILVQEDGSLTAVYEDKNYSAFTLAELGQELPSFVEQRGEKYYLLITRTNKTEYSNLPNFYVGYKDIHGSHFLHSEREDNEVNSWAKMLIYLIEHKLVEVNRNEKNENAKRER